MTMNECWSQWLRVPAAPRPPSRSPSRGARRDPRSAGTSPNVRPAAMATAAENASTRQSMVSRIPRMVSGTSVSRNRIAGSASASAATAPSPESTRLSVRNCAISRPRPAPSAVRTATSRPRAAPRDIRRFARLTQAISRRAADADSRTTSAVCVLPISSSRSGTTIAAWGRRLSFAVICRVNAAISAFARSSGMSGFNRATTCASCHPKFLRLPGDHDGGTQMSMSRAGMK